MTRLYNTAFKTGVLFSISVFAHLNFLSYSNANAKYQEYMSREARFSPAYGFPDWGIPFHWNEKYFGVIEGGGGILNIIIIAICSFAIGFLFNIISSKLFRRSYLLTHQDDRFKYYC